MTDKPIIFSGPMVRALLEGRKTQTRRLLKPQPTQTAAGFWKWKMPDDACGYPETVFRAKIGRWHPSPYAPGDRLWVREAFIGARGYDGLPPSKCGNKPVWYAADGEPDPERWWHLSDRKRSPIHMPRWASRLTLTLTDVRVQQLQDITPTDAIAEGVEGLGQNGDVVPRDGWRMAFADLWCSLHGPGAWDSNPWVHALTFDVVRRNIDEAPE